MEKRHNSPGGATHILYNINRQTYSTLRVSYLQQRYDCRSLHYVILLKYLHCKLIHTGTVAGFEHHKYCSLKENFSFCYGEFAYLLQPTTLSFCTPSGSSFSSSSFLV